MKNETYLIAKCDVKKKTPHQSTELKYCANLNEVYDLEHVHNHQTLSHAYKGSAVFRNAKKNDKERPSTEYYYSVLITADTVAVNPVMKRLKVKLSLFKPLPGGEVEV
jgi:hypothetical protein